jgi:hypothetical protein
MSLTLGSYGVLFSGIFRKIIAAMIRNGQTLGRLNNSSSGRSSEFR